MPELWIHLDDRHPRDTKVAALQPIKGRVEVDAGAGGTCNGLVVRAQWHTHGRGNVATGDAEPVEVFRGAWAAGDRREYPFELPGLDGPLTYHGTHVNLDWRLVATADIPWATDPKAETEVVLVRGDARPDRLRQVLVPQAAPEPTAAALACVIPMIVLFFLAPGLGMIAAGAVKVASGDPAGLPLVPFGLVFTAAACFILFMIVRNRIASRKLGEVEMRVTPERARPGEEVRISVRFRPRESLQLNRITATLEGKEQVVHGHGKHRSTHTHALCKEEVTLREAGELRRLEEVVLEATLRVPADAAPSLAVADNQVVWQTSIHIDIAGWPDWERDAPFVVLPA